MMIDGSPFSAIFTLVRVFLKAISATNNINGIGLLHASDTSDVHMIERLEQRLKSTTNNLTKCQIHISVPF